MQEWNADVENAVISFTILFDRSNPNISDQMYSLEKRTHDMKRAERRMNPISNSVPGMYIFGAAL